MTPELWALEGVLGIGLALVAYAAWPEREPRAPRHPGRQPEHAEWTMHSPTAPLGACTCPPVLLAGRQVDPARHYRGCPQGRPGD